MRQPCHTTHAVWTWLFPCWAWCLEEWNVGSIEDCKPPWFFDTSKEYVSSFLLCISPLLSTLQKHIPALSEEVYRSVSVGQRCRYVSGISTYRLAPTFLALVSLRMLLGIFLALLGISFCHAHPCWSRKHIRHGLWRSRLCSGAFPYSPQASSSPLHDSALTKFWNHSDDSCNCAPDYRHLRSKSGPMSLRSRIGKSSTWLDSANPFGCKSLSSAERLLRSSK